MKFHKRSRSTYWCDTKVFSWMLPEKSKEPFSFDKLREDWANGINPTPKIERAIDMLQDIVMFPLDLVYSIRIHIKNCKGNTHVLSAGLEKGQWYDLTYRIPHCLFFELDKFITQEKGLGTHEWEKNAVLNEEWGVGPDSPHYGTKPKQSLDAIEQDEIWNFWKENRDKEFVDLDEKAAYIEKETEMLIRLIKIRNSLWT